VTLVNTDTGEKVVTKMAIDEIAIGERHRNAFGDIASLAQSIKTVGLINPVTVTETGRLVAGHRRIEACRSLGVVEIPVRIVRSIDSAAKVLIAERDENTCRKEMTPAELASLTDALLEIERPAAKERQAAAGAANLPGASSARPVRTSENGNASDRAAEAAGWSRNSYQRTKRVMDAAEDTTLPESVRNVASVLAAGLADGTVTPNQADQKLKEAKVEAGLGTPKDRIDQAKRNNPPDDRVAKAKAMAAEGYTSRQIGEAIGVANMAPFRTRHGIEVPADAVVGKTKRHDANRIVSETVYGLEGTVMALDLVEWDQLDREQVEQWAISLNQSISKLRSFTNRLKEMAR
jgi:hypothetical protein